jgi:hypothetical protein
MVSLRWIAVLVCVSYLFGPEKGHAINHGLILPESPKSKYIKAYFSDDKFDHLGSFLIYSDSKNNRKVYLLGQKDTVYKSRIEKDYKFVTPQGWLVYHFKISPQVFHEIFNGSTELLNRFMNSVTLCMYAPKRSRVQNEYFSHPDFIVHSMVDFLSGAGNAPMDLLYLYNFRLTLDEEYQRKVRESLSEKGVNLLTWFQNTGPLKIKIKEITQANIENTIETIEKYATQFDQI